MKNLRRSDRVMDNEQAIALLIRGDYGIMSTVDADGQPYGVPLNYIYQDGCIYFHAARDGYKIDNIKKNNRVSFCVVGETSILGEQLTTKYESVISFGIASIAAGEEKMKALIGLLEKYTPEFMEIGIKSIEQTFDRVEVVKIKVEHICGKAHR